MTTDSPIPTGLGTILRWQNVLLQPLAITLGDARWVPAATSASSFSCG